MTWYLAESAPKNVLNTSFSWPSKYTVKFCISFSEPKVVERVSGIKLYVFCEILPKKEIINDDLLEEIDSLSLDKTQKLDLYDIPDLDDVDLPKIKTFEPEEKDIWKF